MNRNKIVRRGKRVRGQVEQRAAFRQAAYCAVEAMEQRVLLSTTTVTNGNDTGPGSLRAAITAAGAGDTIDFAPSVRTVTLSSAGLTINTSLSIVNDQGVGPVKIDGGGMFTVFTVGGGVTASISGLNIANGSGGFGGGINNAGTLTVQNTAFNDNSAGANGGAIENNGSLTLVNDQFNGNMAGDNGGAVENEVLPPDGTSIISLTIANCDFSTNTASQSGGAIDNDATFATSGDARVTIDSSSFSNNSALGGGGIYSIYGTLTVRTSTFSLNTAIDGGGIYTTTIVGATAPALVFDCTFSTNGADSDTGGGIFNVGALSVIGSTFDGNTASSGAGIENNNGPLTVINSTFSGNIANQEGGGLENDSSQVAVVTSSTFAGNQAGALGGGIFNQGYLTLLNTILADNTAPAGPDLDDDIIGMTGQLSASFTLVGDSSNSDISSGSGNILNGTADLGSLGSFGGPTQTIPLQSSSQALSAAGAANSLVSAISDSDMTLTVANGFTFASGNLPVLSSGYYFILQIGTEQLQINGLTLNLNDSANLNVLQRGAEGTVATSHNANDPVFLPGDQRGFSHTAASHPDLGAFQTLAAADVSVSIDPISMDVLDGDLVEFRITVTNNGPNIAQGITLSDLLPAQMFFDSQIDEMGSTPLTLSNNGNQVTDTLVSLLSGQSAVVQVFATVNADLPNMTMITDTATVSSASPDLDTGNNTAQVQTTAFVAPSLTLTPIDGAVSGAPGDTVGWGYTLVNPTPFYLIFVGSQFLLPTFDGALDGVFGIVPNPSFGTYTDYSQFSFIVVPPQSTMTQPFTISADPSTDPPMGIGSFTIDPGATPATPSFSPPGLLVPGQAPGKANGAIALDFNAYTSDPNSPEFDPNSEVGGDHYALAPASVTINSPADISVTKTDNEHPNAVPGTNITYTIVVSNTGPSDAVSSPEIQTLDVQGNPAGTFTLSFGGATTGPITAGSPTLPDNVQAALDALPSIGGVGGSVSVTEAPMSTFLTVTFGGVLTGDQPQITAAAAGGAVVIANTLTDGTQGTHVVDTLPATLSGVSWTATQSGGASGFIASGSGNIDQFIGDLPSGAAVTYSVVGSIPSSASGSLANTVTTSAPTTVADSNSANNSATDTDTLTLQADLSITKTDGVGSVIPGNSVVYTIVVSNLGPSDSTASQISDTLPSTLTNVAWTASGTGGATGETAGTGNSLSQTLDLPFNSTVTYLVSATVASSATGSLSNTATIAAPIDNNLSNNSATDTDSLIPQAALSVTKTDNVTMAVPGTTVTYTIILANTGPSDAPGTLISDTPPVQIASDTYTVSSSGGASGATSGSGALSQSVNLPANSSITYTMTAAIASSGLGMMLNQATISPSAGVIDTNGNFTASDIDTLSPSADVSVVKTGPATSVPGQNLTYTLTTTNSGPSDALAVNTADSVPAGSNLVSFTQNSGPMQGSTLPAGGVEVFTVVITTDPAAPDGTVVRDIATVDSGTFDPNPVNNTAQFFTTLNTNADLAVTKTGPTTAVEGSEVTYTITVTDNGPADAANVVVTDQLPAEAFFDGETQVSGITATPTDPMVGSAGGDITWTLSALANGSSATFLVIVSGDEGAWVNNVSATTTTTDPNTTNNSATATTTLTDASLSGTPASTLLGTEGADTGPITVATFTDAYGNPSGDPDGAAAFTATITWGDGTTSMGTVTQSTTHHNLYTITGDNTYAEEGLYKVTVHVADEGGSTTDVTEQALIVDAPITANPGTDFTAVEGRTLTNQIVATFTDADPNGTAGDYLANIDWGDGVASAASFVAAGVDGNGDPIFNVIGSHTYHEEGSYNVIVAIQDAGSGTFASETATVSDPAVVPVGGGEFNSVEGANTGSLVLTTFTDPGGAEPNKFDPDPDIYDHYTADIDWGDGNTDTIDSSGNPAGSITFDASTQTFTVTGSHTYSEESLFGAVPYPVTVTIHHESAPDASVTDGVVVSDPAVIATGGFSFTGTEGSDTGPLTLATFTDPGGPELTSDYSASVDWGDGTPVDNNATIIDEGGGVFGVSDNHTYAEESTTANPYQIKVTVHHDSAPDSNTVTDTIRVTDPSVIAAPVPITGVEGTATGSIAVATFTDPAGPEILGAYAPTINWGDGTATTAGTLSYNAATQTFTVSGNHTYKEESDPATPSHDPYIVTVVIHHDTSIPTTLTTTAFIADPAVIGTGVSAISAKKGTSTGTITLATFTDPGGTEAAGDYSATINWGDGSSLVNGTIVLSGGKLSVTGSHTYNASGTFHPTIVIHHETAPDSNTVTDTVNVPANSLTTTGVNISGNEGRNVTATVANFVSGNSAATTGNFTASINWGDGKTSTGTIVKDSTGRFHVTGTHAYAEESTGSGYTVKTTITETGGSTVTASSLAKIADSPLDTPAGLSLSKSVNVSFTNLVLGSFRDQDALNTLGSDYTGTITWGDGTTSAAGFVFKSATANVGSFWSVTGSHKYTTKKTFAVKIVLHDNGSPTKTITINTTIKVS